MRRSQSRPILGSAAVYLLLTAVMMWPLVARPGQVIPNDLGDSLLNIWLMSWNAHVMPLTERWWNAAMFYPAAGTMAFSEHLLGLAPITSPVVWLTGNPVLAYNVAFFLSFPLCALSAYCLAFIVAHRHDAAFLAGVAFGFAPYRMSQLPHVQVESAYWMPLVLVGLHLYVRDRRARWLVLFSGAWVMQALACGYYLIYLSVLVTLWLAWFAVGRIRWAELARIGVAWVAGAVVLSPVLYGYWRVQHAYGMRRWPEEIQAFSADIASLLKGATILRVWGWLNVFDRPESELFPGLVIVLLVAAALIVAWRSASREQVGSPRLACALLVAAFAVLAVGISPAIVGPWKLQIGGVRLLSVGAANRPITVALVLLIVAAALHPAARVAWTRRSALAFYAIGAIVMWLFCLGPSPTLMNRPALYKAPYAWLLMFPGVEGVRVPARFWMLAVLCLSIAAALALRHLLARWPRLAPALPIVACVGVLLDGWPHTVPVWAPPASRPAQTNAVARLELPVEPGRDLVALYRAVEHGRPLINGYSGYFAPHYWTLRYLLERHDQSVLTGLSALGAIEIVVDHEMDPDGTWRAFVGAHPRARVIHDGADYTTYRLEGGAPRPARPVLGGAPLPIDQFRTTLNPGATGGMTDGDLLTRWDGGRAQSPGDDVTADLGTARQVDGVEMIIGGYVADFPRSLRIETSVDGTAWNQAVSAPVAVEAMWAAIDEPRTMPLRYGFPPREARYVRLTQTAVEFTYYWSIAELRIYGR